MHRNTGNNCISLCAIMFHVSRSRRCYQKSMRNSLHGVVFVMLTDMLNPNSTAKCTSTVNVETATTHDCRK